LLQTEATYKAEIIYLAGHLITKCKEDKFVSTIKSHKRNQPNMNFTITIAAKVVKELYQKMK
jgi:hypothetical protein